MDLYLDSLLNLANTTVVKISSENHQTVLKLRLLNQEANCPHCAKVSEQIHQNRPSLIRDLSVFGKITCLDIPRRQF